MILRTDTSACSHDCRSKYLRIGICIVAQHRNIAKCQNGSGIGKNLSNLTDTSTKHYPNLITNPHIKCPGFRVISYRNTAESIGNSGRHTLLNRNWICNICYDSPLTFASAVNNKNIISLCTLSMVSRYLNLICRRATNSKNCILWSHSTSKPHCRPCQQGNRRRCQLNHSICPRIIPIKGCCSNQVVNISTEINMHKPVIRRTGSAICGRDCCSRVKLFP